jgi:hypothetical protein
MATITRNGSDWVKDHRGAGTATYYLKLNRLQQIAASGDAAHMARRLSAPAPTHLDGKMVSAARGHTRRSPENRRDACRLEIGGRRPIQMCEEGSALTQDFFVRGFLRKTWLTKGSGRLMRRISIGVTPPFE